ncbi:VOC family protein [Streptomyces sp. A3M-1-3]|uniref:VOC family protein n=1 Tax=Streptomyces sp. A3M-1-3 TaxID=2962044 RepID=UPI0020B64F0B|nr:VOC family protein [Streptomyces sp. A3M-1-3]MCP3818343.1 VOC family protein [Streptomyces sp. A3M-1-3]
MLTTRYVTGAPNWIDFGTPDIEGASTFYGGLFGWQFLSAGPEAGGYGMFRLGEKTVAGCMALPEEQGDSAWSVYFQSPDADATAKSVEQGGGSVLSEPMDVFDLGRMAVFSDPAGASFATWQPRQNKGLDAVTDENTLCWAELYTAEPAAAVAFYGSVFGWESSEMPFAGGSYAMVKPSGGGDDAAFGGIVPLASEPTEAQTGAYWLPYFEVADCDAAVAKAQELGGKVRMAPMDMEGVGRFAKLADPYGARFAVIKSAYPETA